MSDGLNESIYNVGRMCQGMTPADISLSDKAIQYSKEQLEELEQNRIRVIVQPEGCQTMTPEELLECVKKLEWKSSGYMEKLKEATLQPTPIGGLRFVPSVKLEEVNDCTYKSCDDFEPEVIVTLSDDLEVKDKLKVIYSEDEDDGNHYMFTIRCHDVKNSLSLLLTKDNVKKLMYALENHMEKH